MTVYDGGARPDDLVLDYCAGNGGEDARARARALSLSLSLSLY